MGSQDRRLEGTNLPEFKDIFDLNNNYQADALIKSSIRTRYSVLCKKKIIINEVGAIYIEDLQRYIKMAWKYPVWSVFCDETDPKLGQYILQYTEEWYSPVLYLGWYRKHMCSNWFK